MKLYHWELHQDDIVRFNDIDHFDISKTRFYKVILHYVQLVILDWNNKACIIFAV